MTVWLFDECVRGTHCRKTMCDGLQNPNFMGRFSLILEMVSGETPLDILKMFHLHCMFGDNMSEMVWVMSVRHV